MSKKEFGHIPSHSSSFVNKTNKTLVGHLVQSFLSWFSRSRLDIINLIFGDFEILVVGPNNAWEVKVVFKGTRDGKAGVQSCVKYACHLAAVESSRSFEAIVKKWRGGGYSGLTGGWVVLTGLNLKQKGLIYDERSTEYVSANWLFLFFPF